MYLEASYTQFDYLIAKDTSDQFYCFDVIRILYYMILTKPNLTKWTDIFTLTNVTCAQL